ncbi:MAG: PEGA domain-containing protein, partial [Polyangiales bacterium]
VLAVLGPASTARAYPIPVSIESDPPGAEVYVDSTEGSPIGTTPIQVARIERGSHTLIFKKDNHETARLDVNIRRRRETFRAVLKPLGKLVVSPGNSDTSGAQVVVDGEDKGTIPFEETMQPGRHLVQIKKEGFETFEQWVNLEGGQTYTLPVSLEAEAPDTGSILVAGDVTGAAVYLDGDPEGVTPAVIEDVPAGEHEVEIRPDGMDPHSEKVTVRAGERVSVTPTLREEPEETGSIRVVTQPSGATVTVDGEAVGESPVTADELSPGEHIVEATAEGRERAEKTVTVESGSQRVVSLSLSETPQTAGKIVVNATVDDATVKVDGEDMGSPPVVIEDASDGTHAIVVEAPGYRAFRETCRVGPGRDCDIMARMDPVGTPVKVDVNVSQGELYIDGEPQGPVPFEGELPVGSHRLEVRAEGFQTHIQQVRLRPQSEPRMFNIKLVEEGEVTPEQKKKKMDERMRELREATSHSAAVLPTEQTLLDFSAGWPYLFRARLGIGITDWIEAGFGVRTFGRITDFEGRVKMGWRPIKQISLGAQLRLGGGIGPQQDPTNAEKERAQISMDMGGDFEAKSDPTNTFFTSIELLGSLHFARAGAFTLWMAADFHSDAWGRCGNDSDRNLLTGQIGAGEYPDRACAPKDENRDGVVNFSPGRQGLARLRLGGALEIVVNRHWNVWGIFEGILAGDSRRILGDLFQTGSEKEIYGRLGFTYKFGEAN